MQTRSGRSTVLGKRSHQPTVEPESSFDSKVDTTTGLVLPTPDPTPNPKRPRTSSTVVDDGSNKENVPPFRVDLISEGSPSSRQAARMRRTSTASSVTPTRPRSMIRRYASASSLAVQAMPATHLPALPIATPPSTPPSFLPLHIRAKALLRPTCNAITGIAGRETERECIHTFISSFCASTLSATQAVLYISGTPGTGKTALVNSILRSMQVELAENNVKTVTVNCMALGSVETLWQQLTEELSQDIRGSKSAKSKKNKESAAQIVEDLLRLRKSKCILILDELDHIGTPQSLESLFSLAQAYSSHLRILGIANTHTLTSASSSASSALSVKGVQTVHFAPYTPEELLKILDTRLSSLFNGTSEDSAASRKLLPMPTLTLLTKKIAAQTGDVRATFEVLRGAIDLAVKPSMDGLLPASPAVSPAHVLAALKAYSPSTSGRSSAPLAAPSTSRTSSDSEFVTKVKELGLQGRLVLLAMLLASKRIASGLHLSSMSSTPSPSRSPVKRTPSTSTSISSDATQNPGIDMTQLHTYYSTILTRVDNGVFSPVSRSEFADLLGVLETVGILSLSSGAGSPAGSPSKGVRKGLMRAKSFTGGLRAQEVRFVEGIRVDELGRGLGVQSSSDIGSIDVREEEVRAIWERESLRIARSAKTTQTVGKPDVFSDAIEN